MYLCTAANLQDVQKLREKKTDFFCPLSVGDVCVVAKRCELEQKLLLTAYYRKSCMKNRLIGQMNDLAFWMTLTFVKRSYKVMSTIASHSPSWKPLEIEASFQRTTNKNGLWQIEWSRGRWRYVTPKRQVVTPIRLEPNISKTAGDAV